MINVTVLRNYLANCTENEYMKVCTHIVQSLQKMYNVGYKCNTNISSFRNGHGVFILNLVS